jgi:hypothetical protein
MRFDLRKFLGALRGNIPGMMIDDKGRPPSTLVTGNDFAFEIFDHTRRVCNFEQSWIPEIGMQCLH